MRKKLGETCQSHRLHLVFSAGRLSGAELEPGHPTGSQEMPQLIIEDGPTVEVVAGTNLVLAIEDAGVPILHRCGGNSRCTTCRVLIVSGDAGPMPELERERLAREAEFEPESRLSCQVRVDGDLTVRVLKTTESTGLPAGARPEE